jgi:hypothetical protein
VGPLQYRHHRAAGQGPGRPASHAHGCRRCLLKGCERWFRPIRVQARYCSAACQQAARRWRRWRATQRYRATAHGQERRRAQSQRYRQRLQQARVMVTTPTEAAEPAALCEGQRPAEIPQDRAGCPCDRPGCYELFVPTTRSPLQHFCSPGCRQALRCVRQRELRQRARRRHGIEPRPARGRAPPRPAG